uniref:Uncharacterized protein n=1 Tax=Lotus japonicus TaxID=34305 RepID=I3S6B8_LOTJA|nr:unknown [Lotus japonicus]
MHIVGTLGQGDNCGTNE